MAGPQAPAGVEPVPVNRPDRVTPRPQDHRDVIASALSSDSDDSDAYLPSPRRQSLSDLIPENHGLYNDFMRNKVSRLNRRVCLDLNKKMKLSLQFVFCLFLWKLCFVHEEAAIHFTK